MPPSSLSSLTAAHQLRRATAEVLSAVGFASSSDLALQTAADSCAEVMRRLCLRLKDAKEAGQKGGGGGGGSGFSDCLERALAESGGTGVQERKQGNCLCPIYFMQALH